MTNGDWPSELDDVGAAVHSSMQSTLEDLADLVRIPSISASGHDPEEVQRSAAATAMLLRDAGLQDVRLLELEGAHPYVFGQWLHADGDAPTVLLYAHHDVQPVATPQNWDSPPFEPTRRDGRLFARGAADDKAGVMVHVAAVRAWLETRDELPVNVKVIIEGEEEIGSPHLHDFLDEYADLLRADVIVITDAANWKIGVPALTYTLRGLAEVYVTVRSLEQPVHSGMWGGPIPDALSGLLKMLAGLTDDTGRPAVDGIFDDVREPTAGERARFEALDADPDELRDEARMLDGVQWTGDPDLPLLERLWMQPSITTIGIDVPSVRQASNTLLSEARAKVSIRLAPGQDPARVAKLVARHLEDTAPWGLSVDTELGENGDAWMTDPEGPAFEAALAAMRSAFGTEPALLGCGGSIPFVKPFSEAFGGAPCLLTGVEDPASNAHGEDESLYLEDFEKACLAEVALFAELARRGDVR